MKEYIVPFTDDADMEKFEAEHGTNGELVRCKDCKYWKKSELLGLFGGDMICDYAYFHKYYRNADDFCSKAERKEE